ncbi:helix-turn-helix transcriptional regulator [Flavobacterium sp.]|uniref:helix-turn-helix domain-containing protein n=1 Tax=Flavobacterium sp. TaxID=239 RepID=UPI00260C873D|nr:helix-turn-helix transcriptional regulator [Flavobacterium sp.]
MASFGKFIKTEREKKGWSQTEFGALIKVNTPLVSRIENDKKSLALDKIKLLSELFGMNYDIVKDLYFADKFAKEAFQYNCSDKVFVAAETQTKYFREINSKQGKLKF